MSKYSIGIDFGVSEAYAVLLEADSGKRLSCGKMAYPHGVMKENLPSGAPIPEGYALLHPMDFLDVLSALVPKIVNESGVSPDDISGIGIASAPGALLPVMNDGTPLCFYKKFVDEPEAYVKLPDSECSDEVFDLSVLPVPSGKLFSENGSTLGEEHMLPKIKQLADRAPLVFDTCDYLIDACDWIVWQLSGKQTRNAASALLRLGKDEPFFKEVLELSDLGKSAVNSLCNEKLDFELSSSCAMAGKLSPFVARSLGLSPETLVTTAIDSALAAACSFCGNDEDDRRDSLFIISGDNDRMIINNKKNIFIPDTIKAYEAFYPGLYTYEYTLPGIKEELALLKEKPDFSEERLDTLAPGECGVIYLDGSFIGDAISAESTELFRAVQESQVFEIRRIFDKKLFENFDIKRVYICGESAKDSRLMKIFADVFGCRILYTPSEYISAIGAAAIALSYTEGLGDALDCADMGDELVRIAPEGTEGAYAALFDSYRLLSNYFRYNDGFDVLSSVYEERELALCPEDAEEDEDDEDWEAPPTLASEFGIFEDYEESEADEKMENKELNVENKAENAEVSAEAVTETADGNAEDTKKTEYSPEVKAAAASATKELMEAIEAVAAIRDDAEVYAAFKDLIEEQAQKNTEEIIAAASAVAGVRSDSEFDAAFKDIIEEEAEKRTQEIIAAAEAVAGIMNEADHDAVFGDLIEEEAEKNTQEILKAVDETVAEMNEAEHQAVFGPLIEEEAEKNTQEILRAVDETVAAMNEAEHQAVFGAMIEEEAEKSTQEILKTIDEIVGILESADKEYEENRK